VAISKTEGVVYGAGALALISSLVFRKRMSGETAASARIFGTGAVLTGLGMTMYRRRVSRSMIQGIRGYSPLGIQNTEEHHSSGGQRLKVWDDPTMSIKDRVYLLQGLVASSVKDPSIRKLALGITGHGQQKVELTGGDNITLMGSGCPARDDMCEAEAIFNWVANPKHVRYTGDTGTHALSPGGPVEPVDEFQSAIRTVEYRGGDCDDHAILNASLAVKNGFPAKFRITSNNGDSWDHIYTMVGVPKLSPTKWVALDTTLGTGYFNKQPKRAKQIDFAA